MVNKSTDLLCHFTPSLTRFNSVCVWEVVRGNEVQFRVFSSKQGRTMDVKKNVKLIGLLAQGMRSSAWLFYGTVIPVQDFTINLQNHKLCLVLFRNTVCRFPSINLNVPGRTFPGITCCPYLYAIFRLLAWDILSERTVSLKATRCSSIDHCQFGLLAMALSCITVVKANHL